MIESSPNKSQKEKMTSKRILAILGIVLLVALYVVTLIVAIFFDPETGSRLLYTCLYATVAVPLLIWIYSQMYDYVKKLKDKENE